MNRLPSTVKIGPYTYRIEVSYKETNWGHINHTKQLITLDSELTELRQRAVLWHEIGHAIYEIVNIRDGDDQERILTATASLTIEMLRENPALVRYLAGDDDEDRATAR